MRFKKNYISREGRLPRGLFFLYWLLLGVIMVFLITIMTLLKTPELIINIVTVLLSIINLYLFINLIYKREQDRNKKGKGKALEISILYGILIIRNGIKVLSLLNINESTINNIDIVIGIIGIVYIISIRGPLFRRGTKGPNKYGPDPLEKEVIIKK